MFDVVRSWCLTVEADLWRILAFSIQILYSPFTRVKFASVSQVTRVVWLHFCADILRRQQSDQSRQHSLQRTSRWVAIQSNRHTEACKRRHFGCRRAHWLLWNVGHVLLHRGDARQHEPFKSKRSWWLANLGLALLRQVTKRISARCTKSRPGAVIIFRSLEWHQRGGHRMEHQGDGIVMGHM